jgi:hypothetical protein
MSAHGAAGREAGRLHAGQAFDTLLEFPEESQPPRPIRIAQIRKIDEHHQDTVGLKAKIDARHAHEALPQQRAAHQQHQGQRHFRGHEGAAPTQNGGTACAALGGFQSYAWPNAGHLPGGNHPEQKHG